VVKPENYIVMNTPTTELPNNTKVKTYTVGSIESGAPCCEPTPHMRIANLSVAYDDTTVIDDVSIDIYKGCITALIGPSGCGKTSFLTALNRLTDLIPTTRVWWLHPF